MFTRYTYQDWLGTAEEERPELLMQIVKAYKVSDDFKIALVAEKYFRAENEAVARKKLLKPQRINTTVREKTVRGDEIEKTRSSVRTVEVEGNRVYSRFFYRIVTQENQHLLSNGVTIGDSEGISGEEIKKRLGAGFDTTMARMGEKALIHGVCWGYWNHDHLEAIEAAKDKLSGFVALVDEETSAARVGVQFWQLDPKRPLWVRLFEEDGVTVYRTDKDKTLREEQPKRAYKQIIVSDVMGDDVIGGENYGGLPIVPLYANPERMSELDNSTKSKIDAYDRITSDFTDNLDRANDVYWVLNNFGGTVDEIAQVLEQINRLKAVVNVSDGAGGSSTAEPHTIEVPYQAREKAMQLLSAELYKDSMSLSLEEITGGSLTNVAIRAATTNLNLKCDRYEWQCFAFVQQLLRLLGIETESISFVRQALVNQSETVSDIDKMLEYIDDQTALELNPLIMPDQIEEIMERKRMQRYAGTPTIPEEVTEDDGEDDYPADDDGDQ